MPVIKLKIPFLAVRQPRGGNLYRLTASITVQLLCQIFRVGNLFYWWLRSFSLIAPFYNKVVPAGAYENGEEPLLYELEHGEECKNGMYPVLAACKKHFKRYAFCFSQMIYEKCALAFKAVVVFYDHMLWLVLPLIEFLYYLFICL